MKVNNGLVTVMVLAVIGMLTGQTLSFSDDGATAGSAPQADGDSGITSETGSAEAQEAQDEPESGETTDNASEESDAVQGDFEADPPNNTEAFEE